MKNIEVEIRSFISKEKYLELLEFFNKNGKLILEDFQETHYFDCEQDLRIQKNNFGSKIWMKKGQIHDDQREEIEIKTDKNDFENLQKLFSHLKYNLQIKWLRDRKEFLYKEIKISLDYTKGYGYIIELEKMSNEEEKEIVLSQLNKLFQELNINMTSKEEFKKKYEEYKQNWRELIQ